MKEQRKDNRDSLFLWATMRLAGQTESPRIKVRNLSSCGMMAQSPVHVACGERVVIELRNIGWVGGNVTWAGEGRFGIVFEHGIDCKAVRQIVPVTDEVADMCVRRPLVRASDAVLPVERLLLRRI